MGMLLLFWIYSQTPNNAKPCTCKCVIKFDVLLVFGAPLSNNALSTNGIGLIVNNTMKIDFFSLGLVKTLLWCSMCDEVYQRTKCHVNKACSWIWLVQVWRLFLPLTLRWRILALLKISGIWPLNTVLCLTTLYSVHTQFSIFVFVSTVCFLQKEKLHN